MDKFDEFTKHIRKQRHDFMNELQVVYGYIQVEKHEEAKKYIQKVVDSNSKISEIYSLNDICLGILMEKNLKILMNQDIEVDLFIELDTFEDKFEKYYHKKMVLVNNIFNEIAYNKYKFVHIYIFENELGKSILISSNESVVDELEWMEEWVEIQCGIKDMSLHKYNYNEEVGYRLTFYPY